jgi:hypothetical protein
VNGAIASIAAAVALPLFLLGIVVAVAPMVGILRLAPKGKRLRTYNRLSMWNFAAVREDLGPAVDAPFRAFKRGILILIACFIAAAALMAIAGAGTSTITGSSNAN